LDVSESSHASVQLQFVGQELFNIVWLDFVQIEVMSTFCYDDDSCSLAQFAML
jgi:hypothetical protein